MNDKVMNNIILTNYYADMGGGEFALLAHAEWLIKHNFTVHVFLFKQGELAIKLRNAGVQVRFFDVNLKCGPRKAYVAGLFLVPKLLYLFKIIKPDVIVDYTLHELPFVRKAAMMSGTPLIYRDQGQVFKSLTDVDWRERKLPEWCDSGISGVVCTTKIKSDYLLSRVNRKELIRLSYLGIESKKFDDIIDQFNCDLPIDKSCENIVIGIFGRLIQWKGQDIVIKALGEVPQKNVHLIIVGGTQLNSTEGLSYLEYLKDTARNSSVSDRVHFLGFRDDVSKLMKCCDVICHASLQEPFGLVIVEGMMAGKAIIASDVSGPREIVVDGVTGYLVEPGNVSEYAEKLNDLISDQKLRDLFGTNGRQRALAKFEMEKNLTHLQQEIEALLTKSKTEGLQ